MSESRFSSRGVGPAGTNSSAGFLLTVNLKGVVEHAMREDYQLMHEDKYEQR